MEIIVILADKCPNSFIQWHVLSAMSHHVVARNVRAIVGHRALRLLSPLHRSIPSSLTLRKVLYRKFKH